MKITIRCTTCNELIQNIDEKECPSLCPQCGQSDFAEIIRGDRDLPVMMRKITTRTKQGSKTIKREKEEVQHFKRNDTLYKRRIVVNKEKDYYLEECRDQITGEVVFRKEQWLSEKNGSSDNG